MRREFCDTKVEEIEGKTTKYEISEQSTAYKVTDCPNPSFHMADTIRAYHADENGKDFTDLKATIAEEKPAEGRFIAVVVELV